MKSKISKPIIKFIEESSFEEDLKTNLFENRKYSLNPILKVEIESILYNSCVFENIDFSLIRLKSVSFLDCQFINCKFIKNDFSKSSLTRCEFINCNFLDVSFYRSSLLNVFFDNCSSKYSNYQESQIEKLYVKNSYMYASYFNYATMNVLYFEKVDFQESEFINSPLKGTDLSTCNLKDIKIDLKSIKGCRVNSNQAISILKLLDIDVIE